MQIFFCLVYSHKELQLLWSQSNYLRMVKTAQGCTGLWEADICAFQATLVFIVKTGFKQNEQHKEW